MNTPIVSRLKQKAVTTSKAWGGLPALILVSSALLCTLAHAQKLGLNNGVKNDVYHLSVDNDANDQGALLVNGDDGESDSHLKISFKGPNGESIPNAKVQLQSFYQGENGQVTIVKAGTFSGGGTYTAGGKTIITLDSHGKAFVTLSARYQAPLFSLGTAIVTAVPINDLSPSQVDIKPAKVEFEPPTALVTNMDWEMVEYSGGTVSECVHHLTLEYRGKATPGRSLTFRITGVVQVLNEGEEDESEVSVATTDSLSLWATFDNDISAEVETDSLGKASVTMRWLKTDLDPKDYRVKYEVEDNQIP